METPMRFALPEAFEGDDFMRDLSAQYAIKQEKTTAEHCVYYDTFDWRLYQHSLMLYSTATRLCLQAFPEHTTLASTPIAGPPVFVTDLPDGALRERLAPIIEVRALLKLFTMQSRCTCLRLLNRDEKTVLRLLFEDYAMIELPGTPRLAAGLWLRPVRGYDKQARRVARWLTARGFTVIHDSPYLQGLAAVQKHPGEYSSKLQVQLHPTMRADEATKVILRRLLQVMRQNEAGIIDDIDTEFLHDFRVAVRRTRSALGQIKRVFPAPVTARFQKDFAYLTSITNALRDLDVYLLHKADYQAKLPTPLRSDIEPLFAYIQRQRSKAFGTLRRRLRSKTYADIICRWEAFLGQLPEENPAAAKAMRPISQVARQRLEKKRRGVLRLGQSLPADANAQQLHALRIECKKLRYLLEFFASLFPETLVLVKHLKLVQDNLGRFHDLCVQEGSLQDFATHLGASGRQAGKTSSAIDALIRVLDAEKQAVRQAFPEIFSTFITWLSRYQGR
jgi:CHAD domain-containing protein